MRGKLPTLNLVGWPGSHTYYPRDLAGVTGVTIHYTGGSFLATPEAIALYQISPSAAQQTGAIPAQPFPGIAYHLFVEDDGKVSLCWDLETRVWHSAAVVGGIARNASHVGICYAGSYEPSVAQREGIRRAITWCEQQLGRTLTVEGHRDVYPTACPGPTWPNWRSEVLP